MAIDLTVWLADRPGAMAGACEALGAAGVNIDGCCAYPAGAAGQLHVLVDDVEPARSVLRAAGYQVVQVREVVVHELEDVPGSAGACLRRLAGADVNLQLAYLATATRLVLAADDVAAVRTALGET